MAPAHRPRRGTRRALTALVAALGLLLVAAPAAGAGKRDPDRETRHMMFVGNNWEGTADVIQPRGEFKHIARIDIIPDLDERMAEILLDPVRTGYFLGIRELVGEGNDQYVDDMFTSKDGRVLAVSRPSFRDVVGFDMASGEIIWRFVVDGQRSDHMDVSPDGKHVAVSASTGNVVHVLDIKTGEEVAKFASGDSPHENVYTEDGERLYHASIGLVYTPADDPTLDTTKGERYFQVMDAETYELISRVDIGEKLEEAGYPDMSAAVRPMAVMANERFAYFQVSFFHGFVEYNLRKQKVRRLARLPLSDEAAATPREQYLLDSAHHGLSLNGNQNRLCVAGTMSDYAAIVSRKTFRYKLLEGKGTKPYWATTTENGKYCLVSWSGTDNVSVISFAKKKEIANIPVGDHPQRIRIGNVRRSWIKAQK